MKILVALTATLVFVGASAEAIAHKSDRSAIRVAVYRGPAACQDCPEAMKRAIERLGGRYRVDFVGPAERDDVTPATLARYRIYVQPGGGQDIDGAMRSLGDQRVSAIRAYVAKGGGYLGTCMGAYLAGAGEIGLIRDDPDSEVRRPGFPVRTIADAAVPVRWAGRRESLYYQDGPYLRARPGDIGFRPIATYANGDIAAARYARGKGVIVLSGPHPEADRSWFEDADLPLDRMPADAPLKTLIDQFAA